MDRQAKLHHMARGVILQLALKGVREIENAERVSQPEVDALWEEWADLRDHYASTIPGEHRP